MGEVIVQKPVKLAASIISSVGMSGVGSLARFTAAEISKFRGRLSRSILAATFWNTIARLIESRNEAIVPISMS